MTLEGPAEQRVVKFGLFTLYRETGELRRQGRIVALQDQPFRVLEFLLLRPGMLVAREELLRALWPAGTFVEFDQGLNTAIKKIRAALRDSAENPRFIETVPRKGYRFIAPVELMGAATPPAPPAGSDEPLGAQRQEFGTLGKPSEDVANRPPFIEAAPSPGHGYLGVGAQESEGESSRNTALVGERSSRRLRFSVATAAASFIVCLAAYLVTFQLSNETVPVGTPSVAVLPFADLSREKDQEYFCDGFLEELIGSLTRLANLRVLAASSVLSLKGKTLDLRVIGNRLGVGAVLTGSIRKEGNRLRISAQLVNVRDGSYVWADTYERDVRDVFAIQEEVSSAIVDNLRVKLATASGQPLVKRYSGRTDAHLLYLRGRYFWNKFTLDSLKKAIGFYEQAITLDPTHAPALVGLADSYYLMAVFGFVRPREAMPKAMGYVTQALRIDAALGDAHRALGTIKAAYEWDWAGAERAFKQAIELNPSDAHTRWAYGHYLAQQSRVEESIVQMKHAEELDPLSANTVSKVGIPFYIGRRYQQAVEQFRKAIDLDGNVWYIHEWLGQAYVAMGRYDEAIEALEKSISMGGRLPVLLAELGRAYALSGRRTEARELLKESRDLSKRSGAHLGAFLTAFVYAGLGEKDKAFEFLEKAYQERYPELIWINAWPIADILRSDPRFTALLKKMNFLGAV